MKTNKKQGLAPLLCPVPKILVLGSLPGDESLRRQEYYGHPRNRFWKVISAILNEPEPENYAAKKALLSSGSIALWDVYQAADREGSMDADIRHGEFNDIFGLLEEYPSIKAIGLNGGKAEKAFQEYCSKHQAQLQRQDRDLMIYALPSTSPANASWTMDKLVPVWKELIDTAYEKV